MKTKDKPTPADYKSALGLLFRSDPKVVRTRRTEINRHGHDTSGECDLAFTGWHGDLGATRSEGFDRAAALESRGSTSNWPKA